RWSRAAPVGRRLLRSSDAVRLPAAVPHGRLPSGCSGRTWHDLPRPEAGPLGFRTACWRACQRSPTPPGPSPPRHNEGDGMAFRVFGARRPLGVARWRGSILGLPVPLSPLRGRRYRGLRLTRGQRGGLALRCLGLAPFNTVPVCPGTPERRASAAGKSGSDEGADAVLSQLDAVVGRGRAPTTALRPSPFSSHSCPVT